ncbi:hypothetical protein CLV98_11318 [Dyadobacter jejuensis]|uniref:Outer membrane protein with beta-barrel domain n=1 Tax=Dyadobacter jejuensis TaxID=1082580 RepID=A0A316AD57_9BACT|nr:hypothetical protein [Dyadobacter jejuensis]PWJ55542.1 hypothetical protein CLV98_11318 [Dyadobacter jejuensis]
MKNTLIACCLLVSITAQAQLSQSTAALRKWYMPDHIKFQFAGNIGFMAGGPGYISRNKTLETDLLFGFVPKMIGGDALISITAKTTYSPWRIGLKNENYVVPFSTGAYLNYTFGPQFDSKWPDYYPKGYYWWATSFRPGAYIGGKIGRNTIKRNKIKNLELYYEIGTYDLLLISYVLNPKFLKPSDILSLSLGLKIGF